MSADAHAERARMLLDNARAALDREGQLLDVVGALTDEIRQLWRDLAELHDEHLALSNRIEAVTRAAGPTVREFRPRRVTRYCFECEHPRVFTEGKCDHCTAPLQPEAEPIG